MQCACMRSGGSGHQACGLLSQSRMWLLNCKQTELKRYQSAKLFAQITVGYCKRDILFFMSNNFKVVCLHHKTMLYMNFLFVVSISLTCGQQYRLVPTCTDEPLDPENPVALKGDKGERGIPGKSGPSGEGIKGTKGEIGNCSRFQVAANARLDSE